MEQTSGTVAGRGGVKAGRLKAGRQLINDPGAQNQPQHEVWT